jgi:hypothetical protein
MGHSKTSTFRHDIAAHLVVFQALTLAVVAWVGSIGSVHARESRDFAATRQLAQVNTRTTIQGELICTLAEANNGRACPLQLKNAANGDILNVADSHAAMRLFQDGKTQVVATGEINGGRFRILSIRAE